MVLYVVFEISDIVFFFNLEIMKVRPTFLMLIVMNFMVGMVAQPYRIGDLYRAPDNSYGIVYYLFPDGSGGWAVALQDVSTGAYWGQQTDVPGLNNQAPQTIQQLLYDTLGYYNTQMLRNYQGNNSSYAASLVAFPQGWYLPSVAQLRQLYASLQFIDSALVRAGGENLSKNNYWSSSENNTWSAWYVSFDDGGAYSQYKTRYCRVRAVRSFTFSEDEEVSYQWSTGDNTPNIIISPEQTTTYSVTVSSSNGCSDTASQAIVVLAGSVLELTETSCDSYEWNGQIYTESGDYSISTPGEGGCDNVTTLHLTIEKTPQATILSPTGSTCDGEDILLHTVVENSVSVGPPQVPNIAVGDILCTDGSVVKLSSWPAPNKTAKGIVFYVDNTGEHGWAVHLQDQATAIQWCYSGVDVVSLNNLNGTTAYMDLDGYQNTQIIREAGSDYMFPAAYIVDFDNGWYLPALGQLRLVFAYVSVLNTSLGVVGGSQFPMNADFYYWSSTESSYASAWRISNKGFITGYSKDNLNYTPNAVRSVCSF